MFKELGELQRTTRNAFNGCIYDTKLAIEFALDHGARKCPNHPNCAAHIQHVMRALVDAYKHRTMEHNLLDDENLRYVAIMKDLEHGIPSLTYEVVHRFDPAELWSQMSFDPFADYRDMLYVLEVPSSEEIPTPIPTSALNSNCCRPFVEIYLRGLETAHASLRKCVQRQHSDPHACYSEAYSCIKVLAASFNIANIAHCPHDHCSPIFRRVKYQFGRNPEFRNQPELMNAMKTFHDSALNLLARHYIQLTSLVARTDATKCYYDNLMRLRSFLVSINAHARSCRRDNSANFNDCMEEYLYDVRGMYTAAMENLLHISCHNHGINDFLHHAAQEQEEIWYEHLSVFGENMIEELNQQ